MYMKSVTDISYKALSFHSLYINEKKSLTKVLREKQQNENNTQFHNYSQLHMN